MFFSLNKSKLGVDIGTSSIKLVQLKKHEERFVLETYGVVNVALHAEKEHFDAIAETAGILKELVGKSRTTTKKVVASLPNNIVFVSMIEMPNLSDRELEEAIEWEARRYVPLPLEEVTLSWSVLREPPVTGAVDAKGAAGSEKIKVLLTAVPTTVIDNYLKMFKLAGLEPSALEIEALALIRSLVGSDKGSYVIIDIGARSTSLNLVDRGFLRVSRNVQIGGETVTAGIAEGLRISPARAEQFKRDLHLSKGEEQIPQSVRPTLDAIRTETAQLINIFESSGGKIKSLIFTGAGSLLPNLPSFFSDLGIPAEAGNPLKNIDYDERLKSSLQPVSLSLSVALGLAMRE